MQVYLKLLSAVFKLLSDFFNKVKTDITGIVVGLELACYDYNQIHVENQTKILLRTKNRKA